MNDNTRGSTQNYPSARDEIAVVRRSPGTATAGSITLAFDDKDFLLRDELRPVRLQLELLKAELVQQEQEIGSTVVIFGSARIKSAQEAAKILAIARDGGDAAAIKRAEQALANSRYYEQAQRLGELVAAESEALGGTVVVTTGGGPGIMEAGNRGAYEAGARSMGMGIVLPFEEAPNAFISPELNFRFHYFAIRKMHFLMRAVALVSFPGGFGTLDELFETLTLTQTGKIHRRPLVLVGREFWQRLICFDVLVENGLISPEDISLFHYAETAEEAWDFIKSFYRDKPAAQGGEA